MIKWSVKNKTIVIMLSIVILIAGFALFPGMEKQENPSVAGPIATVTCIYPGASPEDIEKLIIKPIEEEISGISQIKTLESFAVDSVGLVKVRLFDLSDSQIDAVWEDLKEHIDDVKSELPDSAYDPEVETDFTSSYGLILGLTGENYDYEQLNTIADSLEDELLKCEGIKDIEIDGKINRQVNIELDLAKLQQYNISASTIATALTAHNVRIPGGNLELDNVKIPVEISGEYSSIDEIENTIIGASHTTGLPVYLKEVADVKLDYEKEEIVTNVNGKKGLLIGVQFADGTNILNTEDEINQTIAEFEANQLYKNMTIEKIVDQADYVNTSMSLFQNNLISAVLLVLIVVVLAMGIKSAIIVSYPIPIVIAGVFIYMYATDIPVHQVSIMSLIISLSLLVANGIVSNDNINVYLDKGESKFQSCTKGVKEVKIPILTSTLTTIASFLPLILMEGSEGKFVRSLPILVSIALIGSYLTSLTVVPAMGYTLLKEKGNIKKSKIRERIDNISAIFENIYEKLLKKALKIPSVVISIFVIILVLSLCLIPTLNIQLFPPVEREQYIIDVTVQEGSTINKTKETVQEICSVLDEDSTVENYACEIGNGFMKYYVTFNPNTQATNKAQILVNGSREGISNLENKINNQVAGAVVNFKLLEIALPVDHPIEIRVSGSDIDTLKAISQDIKNIISQVDGTKNIEDNFGASSYKISVNVNEEKSSMVGITNYEIAAMIRMAINGQTITQFKQEDIEKNSLDVVLKIPYEDTNDSSILNSIFVTSSITGENVPLSQLATLKTEDSLNKIVRRNQQRTITIGTFIDDNYSVDEVQNKCLEALEGYEFPQGYTMSLGGETETRTDALKSMIIPAIIAVLLIYLIIVIQFGDLGKPLIIMGTIPLSFIGVIIGLKILGYPIGFMALLGTISLMGVVVNNGIVILDYIDLLVKNMEDFREAILQASKTRLRPIMVGMVTTVISLIPLCATGGALWAPLATAVIFGMLVSSVLTMLVIPCAYFILYKKRIEKLKAKSAEE